MTSVSRQITSILLSSALALVPVTTVITFASVDIAVAKDNGKGGGNGGGNGGGRSSESRGKSDDRGKSANAKSKTKDSKGKPSWAGGNRSAKSNQNDPLGIGKAFRKLTGQEKKTERTQKVVRKQRASTAPEVAFAPKARPKPRDKTAYSDQLKGLNAANASLQAYANASPNSRVGRIATYREAYIDYLDAVEDPDATEEEIARLEEIAEDAFLAASDGRELTPEAREEFHDLLRLEDPLPGEEVTTNDDSDDDGEDPELIVVSN